MTITLTVVEARHLIMLLLHDHESGEYAGNRQQYYARTERLLRKLEAGLVKEPKA